MIQHHLCCCQWLAIMSEVTAVLQSHLLLLLVGSHSHASHQHHRQYVLQQFTTSPLFTVVYVVRVEVFADTFFKVAVHGVKNVDFLTLFLQVSPISILLIKPLCYCSFPSDYSPPPPAPKRSVHHPPLMSLLSSY